MLKETQKYITENNLFTKGNKILLTVSGGADSVCMTHILYSLGYKIGIAHCNFKLRNEESDKDEVLVKQLADNLQIPFFTISFETKKFAKENKYSIEEAARILRYKWFEKIRLSNKYDFIATAHHAGDNIETFFMKLTNGTGIKGLSGIKNKYKKIVRPLLFASRTKIENYCNKNEIKYRTDKSNSDTNFTRNKFRHNILPLFTKVNPAFEKTMLKNIEIINDIQKIYDNAIKNAKNNCIKVKNNLTEIDISCIQKQVAPKTFLFEFLQDFGFNSSQTDNIFASLNNESGKQFFSDNFRLIKDRTKLIIKEKSEEKFTEVKINKGEKTGISLLPFHFQAITKTSDFIVTKEKNIAYFDFDKLSFPLTIRTWQKGDFFYPFGMKGKKLLSDFFTDVKLNHYEKENTYLLTSGNDIIWIAGMRTDDRYKITDKTKMIYIVSYFTENG